MQVGSLSSQTIANTYLSSVDASVPKQAPPVEETTTVADHVAAADEQEPIRSVNATQGTLVDTYL